jgi:hypothetical protein
MWQHVVDVSEEPVASIFRIVENVNDDLQDYTASRPKRQYSSYRPENRTISQNKDLNTANIRMK